MKSVVSHLHEHASRRLHEVAYGAKIDGHWRTTSWGEFDAQVRRVGRALLELGVPQGGTVGILSANRPEWALGCLGALSIGSVPAGIYQTCAPNQVAYILRHARSRVVLVEDAVQAAKVQEVRGELPDLSHVVVMDEAKAEGNLLGWQDFLEHGRESLESARQERELAIVPEDLATLIYTSGTTGTPKAVMLSHSNILETGRIGAGLHRLGEGDTVVSYLPLAHIAEQMISIHIAVYAGYRVFYAESPLHLADNLVEIEPTLLFGVPRVWEKIASAVLEKVRTAPIARRKLFHWALETGRRVTELRNRGQRPGSLLAFRYATAERLVLEKVRKKLGMTNVRVACCGAAPVRRDVLDFFAGLGIPIFEVWGLSECCGPGTWNYAGHTRLGTVGPPLPEVEVRIADDGEVLLRGPNVFQGYLGDPEATAEALVDGWLHTGDLGSIDDEGYLSITGRKKELIITSGGKNIAPTGIEALLKQDPLLSEAVVIGDDRKYLTVLVTLDEEVLPGFKAENGIEGPVEQHPAAIDAVEKAVARTNRKVARVETLKAFRILPRSLTLEDGELTPTLKVKRRVVHEHFADLIEEMYE